MSNAAELLVTMTKSELRSELKELIRETSKASEPEVLTRQEAADLMSVHPKFLMQTLVKERGFPVHYIGPQDPRFRRSECLAWLSSQPSKPVKELGNGGS